MTHNRVIHGDRAPEYEEALAHYRINTENGLRASVYVAWGEEGTELYVGGDRMYGAIAFVLYHFLENGEIPEVTYIGLPSELTRT